MRILLIGASGTIGSAITDALGADHTILSVGRSSGDHHADIAEPDDIAALYDAVETVDAVVCAAGEAAFAPLDDLGDEDFQLSLRSKLMGQVNLVRHGLKHFGTDASVYVLTSGVLSEEPMPGSAAISLVNAGLEGFVRAAALDAPDGVRINVVSPPWVSETLDAMGEDPSGGLPAATVAQAYVDALTGTANGAVLDARNYA
jgi:NAD(P)-dependent dehydrogenase (short-subunit alcohol dehydrogenase family)